MTQTVPTATPLPMNLRELLDLGWGNLLYLLIVGLVVLAFKNNWIGIITFGPNDRGLREFFGRPRKLLRDGPHPYIKGLSNMRRASIAVSVIDIEKRVHIAGRTWDYKLAISVRILDARSAIMAAIYTTFDETKTDAYNAQRLSYIHRTVAAAIKALVEEDAVPFGGLSSELIMDKCGEDLIATCGTEVVTVMLSECAPSDAQTIADVQGVLQPHSAENPVDLAIATVLGFSA